MMRQGLRAKASIMMSRNNLIDIAIEQAAKDRPGLEQLLKSVSSQCAVVTTDVNPFRLFREMESTKSAAPAKPGDIAPEDILIKAGDTPFKPGPIVGELQKAGIPAGIEGGKIVIKKDKVLVKKGEAVSEEISKILPKLEIMPMTVGLNLVAAFEGGVLYGRDVLNIPEDYYSSMLSMGSRQRHGLEHEDRVCDPADRRPTVRQGVQRSDGSQRKGRHTDQGQHQDTLGKGERRNASRFSALRETRKEVRTTRR